MAQHSIGIRELKQNAWAAVSRAAAGEATTELSAALRVDRDNQRY